MPQIGVSSYSFMRAIRAGQMTQFDSIAKAAELGFDFIEFSELIVPDGESAEDYALRIKEECARRSMRIGNYTIGADLLNAPDGTRAEVERLCREVDLAVLLGAPGMRHDVTSGRRPERRPSLAGAVFESFDKVLPVLAEACRDVSAYAAIRGVRTMSENHGYYSQDSDRMEKLIAMTDHPNYGALIDIGNFLCADEQPEIAVGRLTPYAFHCHVKDFHVKSGQEPNPGEGWFQTRGGNWIRGAIIGHGNVPIRQCLQAIRRTGYDGGFSIEFEGLEDSLTGVRIGLQNLRAYLSE